LDHAPTVSHILIWNVCGAARKSKLNRDFSPLVSK